MKTWMLLVLCICLNISNISAEECWDSSWNVDWLSAAMDIPTINDGNLVRQMDALMKIGDLNRRRSDQLLQFTRCMVPVLSEIVKKEKRAMESIYHSTKKYKRKMLTTIKSCGGEVTLEGQRQLSYSNLTDSN